MGDPHSTRQVLYLLLSALLVALTAFFVAAEFALVKVRATRIAELAEDNVFGARRVRHALTHLNDYLSAAQLGITVCALVLGNVGHEAFQGMTGALSALPSWAASILTLALITLIEVVIGEMAPKAVAIQNAEKISLAVIYPLDIFYQVLRWPIRGMIALASLVLRPFGYKVEDGHGDEAHSEAEIRSIVASSGVGGAIDKDEVELVHKVFDFSDRTAREVMVPRPDVLFLPAEKPLAECVTLAEKAGFSRYPVIEGGSPDHIVGLVHIKDLLLAITRRKDAGQTPLKDTVTIRPTVSVPETKLVDELLRELQRTRQRLAIVADEYGGTAGIVTLEDIVEELVGDLQDEFDRSAPELEPAGKDCWTVAGGMSLDKLARTLGFSGPDEEPEVDTVGGWIMVSQETPPRTGDSVPFGEAIFTVTHVAGRRIRRVRVCLPESDAGKELHDPDPSPLQS
jgi:CBS domain containing-hemolysin-like protein